MKIDKTVSWTYHFLKHEDTSRWPVMFIYSEADKLVPWQGIASIVQEQRLRRRVEEVRLTKSGHVAHLKMYPDLYTDKVAAFLSSLY